MLNKNKIKNKKYVFILGIITHIILIFNIFLYLLKNTKTTYNIIFTIVYCIGHLFIIINLIRNLIYYDDILQSIKDKDKNKHLYDYIGHLNLFIFGILLFVMEYNKISKKNNYINLLYTLNQFIFMVLLVLLNYNIIKDKKIEFIIMNIVFTIFILIFLYKILISSREFTSNLISLFIVLIYIIYLHFNLFI
jgi:hypothetical protein